MNHNKPSRKRQQRSHSSTVEQNPSEEGVKARFFPSDFPAEVVLTDDDMVWLFTEGHEVSIPLDTTKDIAEVIEHVKRVADNVDRDDEVVANISAFTGIFRFLGDVGDNSYLNPPERTSTDYGTEE